MTFLCCLKEFDLSDNSITELPHDIWEMKFSELKLNQNSIASLPEGISRLNSLTTEPVDDKIGYEINLRENAITTLPSDFGQLLGRPEKNENGSRKYHFSIDLRGQRHPGLDVSHVQEAFGHDTTKWPVEVDCGPMAYDSDDLGNLFSDDDY